MASAKKQIKNFIIDVDGVLTDGSYFYTAEGKVMKVFGPDDHDALLLLKPHLHICMVTGDKKGFGITKKRVEEDMKFPLHQVSTFERSKWINENFNPNETIYMGDGIFDSAVFETVAYGIAPANAFYKTKEKADFVTQSNGGNSAVAEAAIHIMEKFFEPLDLSNVSSIGGGEWK
jgi:3-deoxy-D-manno-octulosonate 8-phosphate phosphatase (KDO 8-P phosphatase)